jgi:hypothetical protein
LLLGFSFAWSCSDEARPPHLGSNVEAGNDATNGLDAGLGDGPPGADASGLCGNQLIPAVENRPNLYFVIDRSGSMQLVDPGQPYDRYTMARVAIARALRLIGHRVSYGAAVFPSFRDADDCAAGLEIFPTTAGDPPSYASSGVDGPVLLEFLTRLATVTPDGGTPTSATLRALQPALTALSGTTYVVLATDGAPNCNPSASCGVDQCERNLQQQVIGGRNCDANFNCCDPTWVVDGPLSCIDADATEAAVAELAQAGIQTFVIGMPGSATYASVLDRLALAGGTARSTSPRYYSVNDGDELAEAVRQIGVSVAITCDIALNAAPPDPKLVNVYFDNSLLAFDEIDGWAWTGETTLQIRGAACEELLSGEVLQVQIVAGCPTVVR